MASIPAKDYVRRRKLRHILEVHLEEAYDAGYNSQGRRYYTEISEQPIIAQLQQLIRMTFDGDLIGKTERDYLVERGYATRVNGWNIITPEGIKYLEKGKFIHP